MEYSSLKKKLKEELADLEKISGVDGTLVVDNLGEILYSNIPSGEVSLFGSMTNVISNSSLKLLKHTHQGSSERILLESSQGKALFLNLNNAHLLILAHENANIGQLMLFSKKVARKIKDLPELKSLEVKRVVEEEQIIPTLEKSISDAAADTTEKISINEEEKTEIPSSEFIESVKITEEPSDSNESLEKSSFSTSDKSKSIMESKTEIEVTESDISPVSAENELSGPLETEDLGEVEVIEDLKEVKDKGKTLEIPVIMPPISFPELPEEVLIPSNIEDKTNLIIDIYEYILLAMSIGASKIMGVAPARGMLKKSLPYDQCPELLNGVDVNSNSTLEFEKIRENLEKYPPDKKVERSIKDFSQVISSITDNYGRVMGYDAFRGMIRVEFKKIYQTFGPAMEELDIKVKIHPELKELLVA